MNIKEECKKLTDNINYLKNNWKKEFIKKTNWNYISWKQDLSEEFIKYFKDNVNWYLISWHQVLSESFIEKHKDYVYWEWISEKQKLSELFIKRNKDKIDFNCLFYNRHITNEFIFNHINWFINKDISKYSWRFEDKEFVNKFYKYKKLFS